MRTSTSRRRAAIALRSVVAVAVLVAAGASACGAPPSAEPSKSSEDPDAAAAMATPSVAMSTCEGSQNTVDQAACPRLRADHCAAAPLADPRAELCRRLFLDLTGVAPSQADVATTCAGRDPSDIAKALMATPAYTRHAEELWAERLAYDPAQIDGVWLDDADRIVDDLVTGRIAYDAFATRIVGHPVFGVGARLPRSDVLEDDARFYPQVAARATQLFLGRAPIAGEDVSLAKLFSFWKKKIVVLNGDYGRAEVIVDPSPCPCESEALGATTRIVLPLDQATPYEQLVDVVGAVEGGGEGAGDAGSRRARTVRSPALRAELDKAGALLASQHAFWTQGADLALAMYLGWWKSTTDLDASVLPQVEVALADLLRERRSWPEMVQAIVTSTLYLRTNQRAVAALDGSPADDTPPWCSGPARIVRPEAYVSSLGHLLDVRVGRCDHRTYEPRGVYYPDGSEGAFFPYALREDEDSDAILFGTTDFHLEAAGALGGCNAGAPRTEEPTLTYVFGMAPAAAKICGASSSIIPPSSGPRDVSAEGIQRIADHVSTLLRGRPTTADERNALAIDTASCAADAACDTAHVAALVCGALARSLDFVTY